MPEYMIDENDLTYEQQEYLRAYAIGTADQWESEAVSVTHNLYGNSAPKGIHAFSMHDTFMDDDFSASKVNDFDDTDYRSLKPLFAPDFPNNKIIDYVNDPYHSMPSQKSKIILDDIRLFHSTWIDPIGHVLRICTAVMGNNGYVIWETYSWEK